MMNADLYEVEKSLIKEIESEKKFSIRKLVKLIELSAIVGSTTY